MKPSIAITGSNSYLGQKVSSYLTQKNFEVKEYCRKSVNHPYDLKSASLSRFENIGTVIHMAHDFGASKTDFDLICNEIEQQLKAFSKSNIRSIYISSLSAFVENPSRYSRQKLIIERIFSSYDASVIRVGLVIPNDKDFDRQPRPYSQLRALLKFSPFTIVNSSQAKYFVTRIDDFLLSIVLKLDDEVNSNISVSITKGPLTFDQLVSELNVGKSIKIGSIDLSQIKTLIEIFPRPFPDKYSDKLVNLVAGMEVTSNPS